MTSKTKLVVISIPFQRLERSYLSKLFIEDILKYSDLLIISPFSSNKLFYEKYQISGVTLLEYKLKARSAFQKLLIGILKVLRVHGYWTKNKKELPYYYHNRNKRYGIDGKDIEFTGYKKIAINFLGYLGKYEFIWKIINALIKEDAEFERVLLKISENYTEKCLIITSSWSDQDRFLAKISSANQWRNVFIPYTTDQLYCNGFLYTNFDAVCVKGNEEEIYASKLHGIQSGKLVKTGYLSFRLLDQRLTCINGKKESDYSVLLVAGSISKFYPTQSEIFVLEQLLKMYGDKYKIVYRTFFDDKSKQDFVNMALKKYSNFEVQFIPNAAAGLEEYLRDENYEEDGYIREILRTDLVVSLGSTSLSLDAAYLGVATITCWIAPEEFKKRRGWDKLFDEKKKLRHVYKYFPNVFSMNELNFSIERMLVDKTESIKISKKTLIDWDAEKKDYKKELKEALFKK